MTSGGMERHEIEAFLTLAEELHFGRTTERLRLSQGRVSQTIKKLERRLGTPLFIRTSRRVTLTPIGEQLRDDLLPAHQQIQRAIERATAAGRGVTGTLRVSYSTGWCGDLVMEAAEIFEERHPGYAVRIREVFTAGARYNPLRTGDADLQLLELPIDEPDLTCGPILFTEPRGLMVADGHPLAQRKTISLEELADISWVTLTGLPQYLLDAHFPTHTPSGRPIPPGPTATSYPEAHAMVVAGKGAWPVSCRAADYYSRPGITIVPFTDAPPVEYGLTWPTGLDTPHVHEFVEIATFLAPGHRRAGERS